MADADGFAERGGHRAVGQRSNVKMQHTRTWSAHQRIGRAVAARGVPTKLHVAILAGQIIERLLQLQRDADDVRREPRHVDELRRHRDRIGDGFGDDLEIRDDPRLAGMDHVAAIIVAAEHLALDQANTAGAANPGPAIMRQLDAVHDRAVEQHVADIGGEALVVDGDYAGFLPHHFSTSRRMGRTWRVCLIWL